MRSSRIGIFVLFILAATVLSGCSFYNRVRARQNLVDGASAYKNRKFDEAEKRFRYAASLDPNGDTEEGRTAQLSLARTLHSKFIGDRSRKDWAEEALNEYKKSLPQFLKDYKDTSAAYESNKGDDKAVRRFVNAISSISSTTGAIASLYDALGQADKSKEWQNEVAASADYPASARARAYSALASKANTCANDISDNDKTKKTVTGKDGKQAYQYVKPESADDFAKLKQCTAEGTDLVAKAIALEPAEVKNFASFNIEGSSDIQLMLMSELSKAFESVRSYKAAMLNQTIRIAEMDGNNADRDKFKAEYETAKTNFSALSDFGKKLQAEIEKRAAAKEAAENPAAAQAANAANTGGDKK